LIAPLRTAGRSLATYEAKVTQQSIWLIQAGVFAWFLFSLRWRQLPDPLLARVYWLMLVFNFSAPCSLPASPDCSFGMCQVTELDRGKSATRQPG
jgi:hypothetical protein